MRTLGFLLTVIGTMFVLAGCDQQPPDVPGPTAISAERDEPVPETSLASSPEAEPPDEPTVELPDEVLVAGQVTGTVTYLLRIALPADAQLTVQIQDTSLADAPATVVGEQQYETMGQQVPLPFAVDYDPTVIEESHTYTLSARIMGSDGQLLFVNDTSVPVITRGNPSEDVEVIVVQVDTATSTPEGESVTEPAERVEVDFNSISFDFDGSLASGVTAETLAAPAQPVPGPGWSNYPTHDRFLFQDYILAQGVPQPTLAVYPALEAASRSSLAADQIEALRALLESKPPLVEVSSLPYLPLAGASQVFVANAEYLSFSSGEGIRYLTMLSQAANPITNLGLHYTFQGLTNDGRYYVSTQLPVRTDVLPEDVPADFDYDAFASDYDAHIAETVELLNSVPDAEFAPDLAILDDLAQSVMITKAVEPRRTGVDGEPILTITLPVADGETNLGADLIVAGYTSPIGAAPVTVRLEAGTNTLAEAEAVVDGVTGDWTTTVLVPPNVQGVGRVVAVQGDAEESVNILIGQPRPAPSPALNEPAIRLFRPASGDTAVAGYPLFFEGEVTNPIDNSVTIGLLIDDCTRFTARQQFTVGGGGQWNGVILLPETISDERACATAFTGAYGEGDWREVQTPLSVLAPDESSVVRVMLANPQPLTFVAGQLARLGGSAVEAPEVLVRFEDNQSGAVLSQGTAPVGDFGLWEIDLLVPADAREEIVLSVEILDDPPLNDPYLFATSVAVMQPQ